MKNYKTVVCEGAVPNVEGQLVSTVPTVCLIIYPDVERQAVEKAIADIGFVHHETRPGDGDRRAYEQVWATPERTSAVNYIEDPISNLHYLAVRGALVSQFVTKLAKRISVFDGDDLLEEAENATEFADQIRAINRVAIGFADYHPAALAILEGYATHAPHPLLREAAVNAMGFRGWPQFRPALEHALNLDPDENVRRKAAEILPYIPIS